MGDGRAPLVLVSNRGPVTYLDDEEAKKAEASVGGTIPRPWELWKKKAMGGR